MSLLKNLVQVGLIEYGKNWCSKTMEISARNINLIMKQELVRVISVLNLGHTISPLPILDLAYYV